MESKLNIVVTNKHHKELGEYIGRGSPLGNPYSSGDQNSSKAEHFVETREQAIEAYELWLRAQIKAENVTVLDELERLYQIHSDTGVLLLQCFCKPKACHGDVIKKIMEEAHESVLQTEPEEVTDEVMIIEFSGEHRWLSNFWMCPFDLEGIRWPSAEHAYQASKATTEKDMKRVLNCSTPKQAKELGTTMARRSDWEEVKLYVMENIIKAKFSDSSLRALLLQTGNMILIEGNMWNDTYWGTCLRRGVGNNHLGRIIMDERDKIRDNLACAH